MRSAFVLLSSLVLLVGCGSTDETSSSTSGPGEQVLAPPAIGTQLVTKETVVAAGSEQYACWSFQLPEGDDLRLVALEQQVSGAAIHHYAVFTNSSAGANLEEGYECESMGATWGLVTGGGIGTPAVAFPEGAAMAIPGGSSLIVQLHLLNASGEDATVSPQRFNLVGAPPEENLQPVGLLIAGTLDIAIPAHASDEVVTGGCTLTEPMENIFAVFPHMHQLGRRIRTSVTPKAGGEPVSISDITWDFSDQGLYAVSGSAAIGDTIDVKCHYDNTTDKDVKFGLHSDSEMCINVFYHYPATTASKYCGIGG